MTVRRAALALLAYVALAALLTRPLLELSATHIAGDAGDPLLNATVLVWNTKTLPLTEAWWNTPFFYPAKGVTTFTENLLGISPLSTPILWATGNPLVAYNVTLFLSWPLCAFTAFLLVRRLTQRDDAAFVAGLAYGFSPYRVSELGHIQMTASYYLPLILLALHGYVETRRRAWLALFGAAWLLQSLANGYLMLFGAVMIAVWLIYFCTTRSTWRALPGIAIAGAIATAPLLAIMLRYVRVHAEHALRRPVDEVAGLSYDFDIWYNVSPFVSVWHRLLPYRADNHFPGATGLLLLIAGAIVAVRCASRRPELRPRVASIWRWTLAAVCLASVSAAIALYAHGYFHGQLFGLAWRMTEASRPLWLVALSGAGFMLLTPWLRDAVARRSRLLFYASGSGLFAWLACGAALIHGADVVLNPAPYQYLLAIPGFNEARVPARFWMIGVLFLAVAAGLAIKHLQERWPRRRAVFAGVAMVGALADGWTSMPMAIAPQLLPNVEPAWRTEPFVELPIGAGNDYAPGYRAAQIGRKTFNGFSGHEPGHYSPMVEGLTEYDPGTLQAMATFGAFDVVIDLTADAGQAYLDYVSSFPGATPVSRSATRELLTIPGLPPPATLGAPWPIAAVRANDGPEQRMVDGNVITDWSNGPQHPGQWVLADLGQARDVAGVTQAFGEYARDYPRHLLIETSIDGLEWTPAWEGNGASAAFRASVLAPLECRAAVAFAARPARYVRLRQMATHVNLWRITELTVHAAK